jgi:hypothetical protein
MTTAPHPALAAALATLLASGCASAPARPWSRNDLCTARSAPVEGGGPAAADAWIGLLLGGFDARTRRATTPALDCTGAQVVWSAPALACADSDFARRLLPDAPIAAEDVVVSPAGPGLSLVWIVTGRFATGDAVGPVALVEGDGRRGIVRAIGALRAYPAKARLRLERVGAGEVLVAEGEACAGGACVRAARLMPLQGERFTPEPVRAESGRCVAPAFVDLVRQEVRREDGEQRRLELQASLSFAPDGVRIDELVLVQELARKPEAPPRLLHRAQDSQLVKLVEGRFTAPGPSLWSRMAGRAAP